MGRQALGFSYWCDVLGKGITAQEVFFESDECVISLEAVSSFSGVVREFLPHLIEKYKGIPRSAVVYRWLDSAISWLPENLLRQGDPWQRDQMGIAQVREEMLTYAQVGVEYHLIFDHKYVETLCCVKKLEKVSPSVGEENFPEKVRWCVSGLMEKYGVIPNCVVFWADKMMVWAENTSGQPFQTVDEKILRYGEDGVEFHFFFGGKYVKTVRHRCVVEDVTE